MIATRLDVWGWEKTLTTQDWLKVPPSLRARVWLMNLDLSGTSAAPLLFDHALNAAAIRNSSDPDLSEAEANLVRLLQMTPANANLEGTALQPLLTLGQQLGIDPASVLADAIDIEPSEPLF